MTDKMPAIQQYYFAWDLSHRKSSDDASKFTSILSEAKVDLNPHQVDAALFAFRSPLSKGAILADEVGLGKTIEAGLIISQFCAELHNNVLIIVPASLKSQWRMELDDKFYLPSNILTTKEDAKSKDRGIKICSYNYANTYADLLSTTDWDLIVFDEAHKLRNVYKKNSIVARNIKDAFQPFRKILLTATPLQNNLKELYGLISIIDNRFFFSLQTFDDKYNAITTRDAAKYGDLKKRLTNIIQRTLRCQVQEYVNYTHRTSFVQEYDWTPPERELYIAINGFLQRDFLFSIPEKQRPLLSLVIRKILASSSYALSFTLERIIKRLRENRQIIIADVLSEFETFSDDEGALFATEPFALSVDSDFSKEIAELEKYRELASDIQHDSKAMGLIKALKVCFSKMHDLGIPQKALIFTESRRTQEYLYKYLSSNGYNNKIVCFNGSNNDQDAKNIYHAWVKNPNNWTRRTNNKSLDQKQAIVDYFKNHAEIMIATEAGAEGINLQFCSLVVNYDLPWNPQRIEQRIGRCHRYGQKNDVIVVNFVNTSNYADSRVYDLLNDKFKLFDGVFGSSDEILGSLEGGIDIEKRLFNIYQTCRTEREIKAAFDLLQEELEALINERIKQTKKSLIENFDEEVINKLKLRETEDHVLINTYNRHFWNLAKSVLNGKINDVNEADHSFYLSESISADIPQGTYVLNKDVEDKYILRSNSPIGKYILKTGLSRLPLSSNLIFNLTESDMKFYALVPYLGKCGYMVLYKVASQNRYDGSEILIPVCVTKDGDIMPPAHALKLFELTSEESNLSIVFPVDESKVRELIDSEIHKYKKLLEDQTSVYVNYEIDKFEAWSEDNISPLGREIEVLAKKERELKSKIRRERDANTRLSLQADLSDVKKELRQKRARFIELEDEYEEKVDKMTNELKEAMSNTFSCDVLCSIQWSII